MDNETTELIGNYLKEAGLSEEQSSLADSEILCAMFGLQSLSTALSNIANLCGKNRSDFAKLEKNLEENIFNKIPKEIGSVENIVEEPSDFAPPSHKASERQSKATPDKKETLPQNNIGESFEKIILNQAKAMQPAKPADAPAGGIMNHELGIMNGKEEKPANLPIENNESKKEEPRAIHNYIGTSDPYREPIE